MCVVCINLVQTSSEHSGRRNSVEAMSHFYCDETWNKLSGHNVDILQEEMICQALRTSMQGKTEDPGPFPEPEVETMSQGQYFAMIDAMPLSLGTIPCLLVR